MIKFPAALVCLAALASTVSATSQSDLDQARLVWMRENTGSYTFAYSRNDKFVDQMAKYPWTIQVQDDKAVKAVDNQRKAVDSAFELPTLDDMFEMIDDATLRNAAVNVLYNEKYGYPFNIVLNYDKKTNGNEVLISISNYAKVAPRTKENPAISRSSNRTNVELQDLLGARDKWNTFLQSGNSYKFSFDMQCLGCDSLYYPWQIQVRQSRVVGAADSSGSPADLSQAPTMEDIFRRTRDALLGGADEVVVEYDNDLGYPTSV